jgi:hypothetical protein
MPDMTDDVSTDAIQRIEQAMRAIASHDGSPYRAGLDIWSTAMGHAGSTEWMWPTWLLWGALTDWVEVRPEEKDQAEHAMRRAAREWLSLPAHAEPRRAYFDRWLYDEIGYDRPTPGDCGA